MSFDQEMRIRPSIIYAWVTGGLVAAICSFTLFALRGILSSTTPRLTPLQGLHESIGFIVFSIPMFTVLLIPAVILISVFDLVGGQTHNGFSLLLSGISTLISVFLFSIVDPKFFPSDTIGAVSIYAFGVLGAFVLWFRSRKILRVDDGADHPATAPESKAE